MLSKIFEVSQAPARNSRHRIYVFIMGICMPAFASQLLFGHALAQLEDEDIQGVAALVANLDSHRHAYMIM
jgi:hypothetical protein